VSGDTWDDHGRSKPFGYGAITRCGRPSHAVRLGMDFLTPWADYGRPCGSHYPDTATPVSLALYRFGLFPVRSPLLGESRFLFFPAGTEMFQFPAFPPLARCQEMSPGRFPDLGDLRITACSAASRSFSQLSHVLLGLWTPRHPPCTLCSLTTLFVLSSWLATTFPIHLVFKEPPASAEVVATSSSRSRRGWRRRDSNPRPPGCKPGALPAELRPLASPTVNPDADPGAAQVWGGPDWT
jgi:hypothetical protein